MKKRVFILISLFALITAGTFAQPAINFQEKSHDFGNIKEEVGSVSYEFTFTNTGKSNLLIYKAVASCGCTTPLYSKEPIAPGAKSKVKVTYNTADRPGSFQKTITLYTNDPNASNVVLIIRGSVIPAGNSPTANYPVNIQGLRLNRSSVPILEAKIGSIRTETIEMMNASAKPMNIRFNKVPKHLRVFASNTLLKPNQTGTITIKYIAAAAKDYGRREDFFYVYTNEKDKNNISNRILVTANLAEDFSDLNPAQRQNAPVCELSSTRINFGSMPKKTVKTLSINLSNKGKTDLIIRKIAPEYDGIKVTAQHHVIAPGKTTKLNLSFNAGLFNGSVVQRVSLYTNDPKNSISRIYLTAQVQ
jgi:hypothetical protein